MYSAAILHDPIAMLVFGAIATSIDVSQLATGLARTWIKQSQALSEELNREEKAGKE